MSPSTIPLNIPGPIYFTPSRARRSSAAYQLSCQRILYNCHQLSTFLLSCSTSSSHCLDRLRPLPLGYFACHASPFLCCGSWAVIQDQQGPPITGRCCRAEYVYVDDTLALVPVAIRLLDELAPDLALFLTHIRTAARWRQSCHHPPR